MIKKSCINMVLIGVFICFMLISCEKTKLSQMDCIDLERTDTATECSNYIVSDKNETINRVVGLVKDGGNGSKAVVYDTDTWEYEIIAVLPNVTPDNYAALSSDNRKLAYTTWDDHYTRRYVKILDIENQETVDYFKDIPVRTEIIKISWIPNSDLLLYIRNDTNYNNFQTIEILDTSSDKITVAAAGEAWLIRTLSDVKSTAEPYYLPGDDTYIEVKYKDYDDISDNEIWNYYLDENDLAEIYEKYGGVREFDFGTILNRMYVEFSAPRCSPDGKYIVYSAKLERTSAPGLHTPLWVASAIWIYDIEKEESHIIYRQEDEGAIGRVDWISSSELCFVTYYEYQGSRDSINYYNIDENEYNILFAYTDEFYNNVTLLPIGQRKISFTSSPKNSFYEESQTYIMDIDSEKLEMINIVFEDKTILLEQFIFY